MTMINKGLSWQGHITATAAGLAKQGMERLAGCGGMHHRRDWKGTKREPGVTQPPHNFNYFFFAAFFLAFFFAAIIVSFKVNLGIVQVRRLFRTTIAQFYERLASLLRRSSRKNSGKSCLVRQFYATVKKKCNIFVKLF
jgi:hypothetical protein